MKFVQFDLWLAGCNIFPTLQGAAGIAISSNAKISSSWSHSTKFVID